MAVIVTGARLAELQARVDAANRSVVLMAGLTYAQLVIKLMREGPKSGGMGLVRQASAPGEAPAVQLGNLIRDVWVDVAHVSGTGWVSTVGLRGQAPYGVALEFGLGIAARPAWRPSFTPALNLAAERSKRLLTGTASIAPTNAGPTTVQAAAAAEEAA